MSHRLTGSIITNLHNGYAVEVIEKNGEWYKIVYDGQEGYINSQYLRVNGDVAEITETPDPNVGVESPQVGGGVEGDPQGTDTEDNTTEQTNNKTDENAQYPLDVTTISNVKLHIIPSLTSSVIISIESGKKVTVYSKINNWSYILYDNKAGWVRNYSLENGATNNEGTTTTEPSTTTKGYVNGDSVNVRKEANTSSSVVTVLNKNTEITIVGEEGDWYQIEYQDYKGYMSKTLVSLTPVQTVTSRSTLEPRQAAIEPTETSSIKTGYVSATLANVREQSTTDSKIVTALKQKTSVEITGEENDFYKININDGTGYIAKKLIVDKLNDIPEPVAEVAKTSAPTPTKEVVSPSQTEASSSGNSIVDYAKQYLGYKYVYGGATPSGFDCSGFTYYVFKQLGKTLPRTASSQVSSGQAVARANLQPGDLIFFNNSGNGGIGHVGIYIGSGNMIHAANAKRGVVIDTISSGYYNNYYYSARRISL